MNCNKLGPMQKDSIPGPIMDRIGDIDPITHGGGVIIQTSHGPYLEYTEGLDGLLPEDEDDSLEGEDDDDEYDDDEVETGDDLEIFRTHIGRDVVAQFELDPDDVVDLCECINFPIKVWLGNARDPDPAKRARCIVDIATYAGWDEIDDDPLHLGEVQLHLRWYGNFNEEGPITSPGCLRPEIIVPEMLRTLKTIHSESYWDLFNTRFPIVPSEAIQNPAHPWWKQHGKEAVNKLVTKLKAICPDGYVFELREETYGFWKDKKNAL